MKKNILITGVSGFIGRCTLKEFLSCSDDFKIYALVREPLELPESVIQLLCEDISKVEDVSIPCNIDVVIHLAAKAHIKEASASIEEFRLINRDATDKLLKKCTEIGVRRFIFLSTIGVLGNVTEGVPLNEESDEQPRSMYAISKLEAEHAVKAYCQDSGIEYVIIRPPLVIGFDAPGNIGSLIKFIKWKLPLPVLSVRNKRSFIFCANLSHFIFVCSSNELARNETFVVSDTPALSTADLIKLLASGIDKKPLLFSVPIWLLRFTLFIFQKQGIYTQLCGSLEVDSSKAKNLLNWKPPFDLYGRPQR